MAVPQDVNAKYRVDRFEVTGSTQFTPAEFAAVTAPFTGRELTFAEVLQARAAITKLYTDKGYITTGAVIAPQPVENGVMAIQILEGRLEDVKITGNRRLNRNYIRDRITQGAGTPLNVPRLLENLQLLRLDPASTMCLRICKRGYVPVRICCKWTLVKRIPLAPALH
jgi:hemolysin activation/secretion protein